MSGSVVRKNKRPPNLSLNLESVAEPLHEPRKRSKVWPDDDIRQRWRDSGRYTPVVVADDFVNENHPTHCSRHYRVLAQIGHGESSQVYLAYPREEPEHWVVLKQVARVTLRQTNWDIPCSMNRHASSDLKDEATYEQFALEVQLQRLASSQGISPRVEDEWVCERVGDKVVGIIVSEFLGTPNEPPRLLGDLSPSELLVVMPKVDTLVHQLHQLNIIHHDLYHGNNIMVVGLRPYIIDYGMAELKQTALSREEEDEWRTIKECPLLNTWTRGRKADQWEVIWSKVQQALRTP
jgi:serine/threonine protein kinase